MHDVRTNQVRKWFLLGAFYCTIFLAACISRTVHMHGRCDAWWLNNWHVTGMQPKPQADVPDMGDNIERCFIFITLMAPTIMFCMSHVQSLSIMHCSRSLTSPQDDELAGIYMAWTLWRLSWPFYVKFTTLLLPCEIRHPQSYILKAPNQSTRCDLVVC